MEQVSYSCSCVNKYCASVGIQLFQVLLILIVVSVSTALTNIVPLLAYSCFMYHFSLHNYSQCVYSINKQIIIVPVLKYSGTMCLLVSLGFNVDSVSMVLIKKVPVLVYSFSMYYFSLFGSGQC